MLAHSVYVVRMKMWWGNGWVRMSVRLSHTPNMVRFGYLGYLKVQHDTATYHPTMGMECAVHKCMCSNVTMSSSSSQQQQQQQQRHYSDNRSHNGRGRGGYRDDPYPKRHHRGGITYTAIIL